MFMQTIQTFQSGNDLGGNAQPLERWDWVTGNTELSLSVFRCVKHQKWGTLSYFWMTSNEYQETLTSNVCTISINTGSEFKSESARVIRSHSILSKFRQHVRTKARKHNQVRVLTHCKSFVEIQSRPSFRQQENLEERLYIHWLWLFPESATDP